MLQIAFSLDQITGATDIFDINGTVWKDVPKHTLCSVAKGTTNSKLFIPSKQVLLLEEIDNAIKAYGNGTPPVTKPSPPSGLAVDGTPADITFGAKWTSTPSATKYTVAVSPTLAGYPKDVTVAKASFTGATASTEYTVKVIACNAGGCSNESVVKISTIATTKAPATKPTVPASSDEPEIDTPKKKRKSSK